MSMKALEWAMYDVPAEMVKGALLRILLLLADHADTQGRGAFPSQKRIVALTGYSRRTIQNGLHDLEKAGLIRRGDQRITEHLGKYRPIVWDLAMKDFRGAKTTPLEQPPQEAQTTAPLNKLEGRNQGRKKTSLGAQSGAQHDCAQNLYKEEPYIEPRESNARARKQIPIPADWKPTEEHQALADRLGIDCDIEADKFRDRALDSEARSADWNAKYRNWLVKGKERGFATPKDSNARRRYTWASEEVKRVLGPIACEGTDTYMELACKVADLLNRGVDPDMLRRISRTTVRTGGGMNAMTIAHMAGVLTSAIQAADRLELDALKGPALADMDLDRIRDIKRDCSTCINLLEQIGRERR